jgi:hypothetical protein
MSEQVAIEVVEAALGLVPNSASLEVAAREIVVRFPAIPKQPKTETIEQRLDRAHEITQAVLDLTEVTLNPLYKGRPIRVVFGEDGLSDTPRVDG